MRPSSLRCMLRPVRRVLLLFFHPALERSRVNRRLLDVALATDGIDIRDEYELYPTFDVDVRAEQAALEEAEVVVFQHPFYWYSGPALLKQWQDLVLEYGWAYGRGGAALRGKHAVHAISAGGGREAYCAGGYNRFTLPELMRPFEQTAGLCGMGWLTPFVTAGTHRMTEAEIEARAADYGAFLEGLRDGEGALEAVDTAEAPAAEGASR